MRMSEAYLVIPESLYFGQVYQVSHEYSKPGKNKFKIETMHLKYLRNKVIITNSYIHPKPKPNPK